MVPQSEVEVILAEIPHWIRQEWDNTTYNRIYEAVERGLTKLKHRKHRHQTDCVCDVCRAERTYV